jgi:hypothetical protein
MRGRRRKGRKLKGRKAKGGKDSKVDKGGMGAHQLG